MKLSGLKVEDLTIGSGAEATQGSTVTVNYLGHLKRGDRFQSLNGFKFLIGQRRVIAGLEKGVMGMRVGGKRRLTVSPHLAYRNRGAPGIPPNAVLIFDIELVAVEPS